MTVPAYPLAWPAGWKHSTYRKDGKFSKDGKGLSVYEAVQRVRLEMGRIGVNENDLVVSTNVPLRMDGFPRSDVHPTGNSGAAVYWFDKKRNTRCMAIDAYYKVADNIAAIAATLEAMRAIDRHGGAEILERAFAGFLALDAPARKWREVLQVDTNGTMADQLQRAQMSYRRLASQYHPDKPTADAARMIEINAAWEQAQAELRND